jgi:Na+/melibiose symporter-like transporter
MTKNKKDNELSFKEDWMNRKWRPMMGWMYMIVCITDFIIFPVFWSIVQLKGGGNVKEAWQPLTLQGAGLFHVAMGVVLGLTTWGRTRERISTNQMYAQLPQEPQFYEERSVRKTTVRPEITPPTRRPFIDPGD